MRTIIDLDTLPRPSLRTRLLAAFGFCAIACALLFMLQVSGYARAHQTVVPTPTPTVTHATHAPHAQRLAAPVTLAAFTDFAASTATGATSAPVHLRIVRVSPTYTWVKRVKVFTKGGVYAKTYAHKQATAWAAYQRALTHAYQRYQRAIARSYRYHSWSSITRAQVRAWNSYQKARVKAYANYLKRSGRNHASITYRRVYYGYQFYERVNGVLTRVRGSYSVTTILRVND